MATNKENLVYAIILFGLLGLFLLGIVGLVTGNGYEETDPGRCYAPLVCD